MCCMASDFGSMCLDLVSRRQALFCNIYFYISFNHMSGYVTESGNLFVGKNNVPRITWV